MHCGENVWLHKDTFETLLGAERDALFVKKAAVAIWSSEVLIRRSVTGTLSNRSIAANPNMSPQAPMTPQKVKAIRRANNYTASEFTICVDTVPVMTTSNRAGSFKLMFLLYFVLNISFPEEVGLTLEFIQRGIASINPPRGTKILKKKKKQHCVSPAVAKLMASLEEYAF
ncbi:uncharacterized protein ISCGN_022082 [Ixodes scapularis]